jgi:hypothetical protein
LRFESSYPPKYKHAAGALPKKATGNPLYRPLTPSFASVERKILKIDAFERSTFAEDAPTEAPASVEDGVACVPVCRGLAPRFFLVDACTRAFSVSIGCVGMRASMPLRDDPSIMGRNCT